MVVEIWSPSKQKPLKHFGYDNPSLLSDGLTNEMKLLNRENAKIPFYI
jgi:hypothetical protein